MRSMSEVVQSCLALFCEDRKPKCRVKGAGSSFPLLRRISSSPSPSKGKKWRASKGDSVHSIVVENYACDSNLQEQKRRSKRFMDRVRSQAGLGLALLPADPSILCRDHSARNEGREKSTLQYCSSRKGCHEIKTGSPMYTNDGGASSIRSTPLIEVSVSEGIQIPELCADAADGNGGSGDCVPPYSLKAVEGSIPSMGDEGLVTAAKLLLISSEAKESSNNEFSVEDGDISEEEVNSNARYPRKSYRRSFPPPLTSLIMQPYCDSKGQCVGAYTAGHCLRAVRKDGRFLLTEVKAPVHWFFRVLRKDGRLKLDLISPMHQLSVLEGEPNADNCIEGPYIGASQVERELTEGEFFDSNSCTDDSNLGDKASTYTAGLETDRATNECMGTFDDAATFDVSWEMGEVEGTDTYGQGVEIAVNGEIQIPVLCLDRLEPPKVVGQFCTMSLQKETCQEDSSSVVCVVSQSFEKLGLQGIPDDFNHHLDSMTSPGCCDLTTLCVEQSSSISKKWVQPMDWVSAY